MSKTILITGTSSGFGKLTAVTLASEGYSVIASMRNIHTSNAEVAKELGAIDNIEVIEIDVTSETSFKEGTEKTIKKYGQIDVLINNAGVTGFGFFEATSIDTMKKLFEINTWGAARGIQAVLPTMRDKKSGLIINITSGLGLFSTPYLIPYNMSKFAIEGMTEGVRQEVKNYGIELISVLPGPFPTEVSTKEGHGADKKDIADAYGPEEMASMQKFGGAMFAKIEETKADPQEVAEAIKNLVEMKSGTRPIQTVVNRMGGGFEQQFADSKLPYAKGMMQSMGWEDFI